MWSWDQTKLYDFVDKCWFWTRRSQLHCFHFTGEFSFSEVEEETRRRRRSLDLCAERCMFLCLSQRQDSCSMLLLLLFLLLLLLLLWRCKSTIPVPNVLLWHKVLTLVQSKTVRLGGWEPRCVTLTTPGRGNLKTVVGRLKCTFCLFVGACVLEQRCGRGTCVLVHRHRRLVLTCVCD